MLANKKENLNTDGCLWRERGGVREGERERDGVRERERERELELENFIFQGL